MITFGRTRYLLIPKREPLLSIRFRFVFMLYGPSDSPSMKPHTNLISEDAGTLSRRHNINTHPPNTFVLRCSTDRGSMGIRTHHLGMFMATGVHREVDCLRHLSCSPR